MAKKTSLKNIQNQAHKKGVWQQVFFENYLKRGLQITIRAHQHVVLEKSHNLAFWITQIG